MTQLEFTQKRKSISSKKKVKENNEEFGVKKGTHVHVVKEMTKSIPRLVIFRLVLAD